MKKLIAFIAFLGLAATVHADGAEFSHNADMRIRYKHATNMDWSTDAGDASAAFDQRVRWGTTFKKGDKFTGQLSLNHNATWGSNGASGQYPNDVASDATGAYSSTGTENILLVNEAYLNWMASDELMVRAGRGSFTMADGRVVAANKYEQVQKAFDGIMFTHDAEWARASFFFVRGAELGTGAATNDAVGDFMGLVFDFKNLPEVLKTANLHLMQIHQDALATVDGQHSNRMGFTVGGETAGVDYNFTYAMHSGTVLDQATGDDGNSIAANMMDLEVGYSMPDMMNFRVGFQYHTDSGDDTADDKNETYTGFHYDTHYNAGLMDIIGYGNLTFMKLGFSMDAAENLNVGLDYYTFSQTKKGGQYFDTDGSGTNSADADETALGSEIDLVVTKKYSDNFNMELRYGQFTPGKVIVADGDAQSHILLTGNMSF